MSFDVSLVWESLPQIVGGIGVTLELLLVSLALGTGLGIVLALMRISPIGLLSWPAFLYIYVFRGTPLLVQLFILYFSLPRLGLRLDAWEAALIGMAINFSGYATEILRSGIEAIPRGQRLAGLAIGLTPRQVYRYVLLPVAYRTIIPPLTSDFLGVFKNSSLALTIGVLELTSQVRQIEEYTFAAFEAFTTATVLYCAVTGLVIVIMRVVERRTRIAGTLALGAK